MGTNAYGYAYDPIGNRTAATNVAEALTYTANALNQYTNITAGSVVVPLYDLDGNLTNYNGWTFAWDAENRLIKAVNGATVVSNQYDYMSRRVSKSVNGSARQFLYDGWAMVQESAGAQTNSYVYGLDLSGSIQGAGTIGGLLSASLNGTQAYYFYDANGNVSDLVATNGASLAHYEFDPYGNATVSTGSLSEVNPFRFSTKYADDETGFCYYGYRYYDPVTGRWRNRDPFAERGGANLFAFAQNDGFNRLDALGQQPRWYTKGFDADAYGLVPWSMTVGYTWPIFVGVAGGASIEVVYDCFDGSAAAFATVNVGFGVGTPGFGVTVGKGLNFIFNLPTASGYAGHFVAVTAGFTTGPAGIYGSVFTTPQGALNLATSGSVGSETWGFGAGWMGGTPSLSILLQYEYFWNLGPVPFTAQQREKICRCEGTSLGTAPSQEIRAMARDAGESYKNLVKQRIKNEAIPSYLSGQGVNQAIDQADWSENIW
jgi:RHS repeat-associated protein